MEFQWSYFKSWKMMLWKCYTHMPADLETSVVATALEKVSFHSNPSERQRQRMFKPLHNCTNLKMATHSSILAWRIPWVEELGGLQSMGRKESDMTERLHFSLNNIERALNIKELQRSAGKTSWKRWPLIWVLKDAWDLRIRRFWEQII